MLVSLLSHTLPIAAVKQATNAFTNGHKKFEHVAITGLAPSSSHHEFGTFIHAITIRRARPESYSTACVYSLLSMAEPSILLLLYFDCEIFVFICIQTRRYFYMGGEQMGGIVAVAVQLHSLSLFSLVFLRHFFFFYTHKSPIGVLHQQRRHDMLVLTRPACGKPIAFLLVVLGTNVNVGYYQTVLPPFYLFTQNDSWAYTFIVVSEGLNAWAEETTTTTTTTTTTFHLVANTSFF